MKHDNTIYGLISIKKPCKSTFTCVKVFTCVESSLITVKGFSLEDKNTHFRGDVELERTFVELTV